MLRSVVALLLLLLSGCAASTPPTGSVHGNTTAAAPDTHVTRLDIAMPGGPSTAIVAFNVSADQWVPVRLWDVSGAPTVADPALKEVCILYQASGLNNAGLVRLAFLRLDGRSLSPASFGVQAFGDVDKPMCVPDEMNPYALRTGPPAGYTASAATPFTAVVVASAVERKGSVLAPFHLSLGVGSRPCQQTYAGPPPAGAPAPVSPPPSDTYCGPDGTTPSQPVQRGGPSTYALFTQAGCDGCGWTVDPNLMSLPGGVNSGSVHANRTVDAPRLIYGYGADTGAGQSSTRLRGAYDGRVVDISCSTAPLAVVGLATHTVLQVDWTTTGARSLVGGSYEFPFDPAPLGWEMAPATQGGC